MDEALSWLKANWFSVGTFIVGFILAVWGLAVTYRHRRIKGPRYALVSHNLVYNLVSNVPSLQILHAGKDIANLTVTRIAFWNAGGGTIQKGDIAKADTLQIKPKNGVQILSAQLIRESNLVNKFTISVAKDKSHIALDFDFLDKDQGAVVQVFHTGLGRRDLIISGTIKGSGKPKRVVAPPPFPRDPDSPLRSPRLFRQIFLSPIRMCLFFLFWCLYLIFATYRAFADSESARQVVRDAGGEPSVISYILPWSLLLFAIVFVPFLTFFTIVVLSSRMPKWCAVMYDPILAVKQSSP
jgi:hypothetical protein